MGRGFRITYMILSSLLLLSIIAPATMLTTSSTWHTYNLVRSITTGWAKIHGVLEAPVDDHYERFYYYIDGSLQVYNESWSQIFVSTYTAWRAVPIINQFIVYEIVYTNYRYLKIYDPSSNDVYTLLKIYGQTPGSKLVSDYDKTTGLAVLAGDYVSSYPSYRYIYLTLIDPYGHAMIQNYKLVQTSSSTTLYPLAVKFINNSIVRIVYRSDDTIYSKLVDLSTGSFIYTEFEKELTTYSVFKDYIVYYNQTHWLVTIYRTNTTITLPWPNSSKPSSFNSWAEHEDLLIGVIRTVDNNYYLAVVNKTTWTVDYKLLDKPISEQPIYYTTINGLGAIVAVQAGKILVFYLNGTLADEFTVHTEKSIDIVRLDRLKHLGEEWLSVRLSDHTEIYYFVKTEAMPTTIDVELPEEIIAYKPTVLKAYLYDITGNPVAGEIVKLYDVTHDQILLGASTTDEDGKAVFQVTFTPGQHKLLFLYEGSSENNYMFSRRYIDVIVYTGVKAYLYGPIKVYAKTPVYYEVYLVDVNDQPVTNVFFNLLASNLDKNYTIIVGAGATDSRGYCLVKAWYPEPGNYSLTIEILSKGVVWVEEPPVLNVMVYGYNYTYAPANITLYDIYLKLLIIEHSNKELIDKSNVIDARLSEVLDLLLMLSDKLSTINESLTMVVNTTGENIIAYIDAKTHKLEIMVNKTLTRDEAYMLFELILTHLNETKLLIIDYGNEILLKLENINTSIILSINTTREEIEEKLDYMLATILEKLENTTSLLVTRINATGEYIVEKISDLETLRDLILEQAKQIVEEVKTNRENITWEVKAVNDKVVAINTSMGTIIAKIDDLVNVFNNINTTHQDIIDALKALKEAIEEKCNITITWTPSTYTSGVTGGMPIETMVYIAGAIVAIAASIIYVITRKR